MLLFTVQKQFFHSFHGCPAFSAGLFFITGHRSQVTGHRSQVAGLRVSSLRSEGQGNLRFATCDLRLYPTTNGHSNYLIFKFLILIRHYCLTCSLTAPFPGILYQDFTGASQLPDLTFFILSPLRRDDNQLVIYLYLRVQKP
jgi:hypothetical protein